MKKKMLSKIIMVAMTVSILLTGCGEQTESRRHSAKNSEVVQEVEENVEKGSLFSGTIFDSLIMGETTKTYAGIRDLPIPPFMKPFIIEQMGQGVLKQV